MLRSRRRYLHRKRNQINYIPYLQIGGMYKFIDIDLYRKIIKLIYKKCCYIDVDHEGDDTYFIVTNIDKELRVKYSRCRPDGVNWWERIYHFKYFSGYLKNYQYDIVPDSFFLPFAIVEASATTNKTINWFLNKNSKRHISRNKNDKRNYRARSPYTTRYNKFEEYSKLLQNQ